jgi:large subunit ribosomal protein L30
MEAVKITLRRSFIGTPEKHRKILRSLGLRKINQKVIHNNTLPIQGMLKKVFHMVEVEQFKKTKSKKPETEQEKK